MCKRTIAGYLIALSAVAAMQARAAENGAADSETLRAAIQKSIPLLEKASHGAAEARECFTCHNQAIPVFALAAARRRGFEVDQENLDRQVAHTATHLRRGLENYREGRGQGGAVLTAGYALWTLAEGGQAADDVTTAVTSYLLEYQDAQVHWSHSGSRPPSSGSPLTATYVALRGLVDFASEEQTEARAARFDRVRSWLLEAPCLETEDHVFRLLALPLVDAPPAAIEAEAQSLRGLQRDDGGWAQKLEMSSDAYATATALYALLTTQQMAVDDAAFQRGVRFLLDTQLDDGSWHVTTRAEPFQTYFESGFPHGQDQFISVAASGWATVVLLRALEEDNASP